jgi:hypothetical protein
VPVSSTSSFATTPPARRPPSADSEAQDRTCHLRTASGAQGLEELFASVTDPDELVRMRAGDALEKICREQPGWFVPHLDRPLDEIGAIEQPSIQWHVAHMLRHLRGDLSDERARRATALAPAQPDPIDGLDRPT